MITFIHLENFLHKVMTRVIVLFLSPVHVSSSILNNFLTHRMHSYHAQKLHALKQEYLPFLVKKNVMKYGQMRKTLQR